MAVLNTCTWVNDLRERRMENLLETTGENTKSNAIDRASDFYIKMAGDSVAVPTGAFEELMATAERQGSVTSEEIDEVLETEGLPVKAELSWLVEILLKQSLENCRRTDARDSVLVLHSTDTSGTPYIIMYKIKYYM